MILVLTGKEDATADYFCKRLAQSGTDHFRFDTDRDLTEVRLGYDSFGPSLVVASRKFRPSDFSAVWLRRPTPLTPTLSGDAAEIRHATGEWTEALEGFLGHIPKHRWINHPSANAGSSHKLEQLTRAKQFGLTIPRTLLTQSEDEARTFLLECGAGAIVKPISSGYLERESPDDDTQVFTNAVTDADLPSLGLVSQCPTMFQQAVNKTSDVRATIIDEFAVFVELRAKDGENQRLDIRRNNMVDVRYSVTEPPAAVRAAILAVVRSYGLRFAAVDFAINRSREWVFLEINPNGQWAWLDLIGGVDIAQEFIQQLLSNSLR